MRCILTLIVASFVLSTASAQSSVYNLNIDSIFKNPHPDSSNILLDYNALRAEIDIENNNVILLMPGTDGCQPLTRTDFDFMKKYNIRYGCAGCTSHGFQDLVGYNKVVFSYLTELYGTEWIRSVNAEVIGIENY